MKPKKKVKKLPFRVLEEDLRKDLYFGMLSRKEAEKRSGGVLNRKTLANNDSQGRGPKRKIIGPRGLVSYYVVDLIEHLEKILHVEERED